VIVGALAITIGIAAKGQNVAHLVALAFAVAGISQVVLERRVGLDFLAVQKELHVHFFGLTLAATLFTLGIAAIIVNFIRYGLPVGEVKPDEA